VTKKSAKIKLVLCLFCVCALVFTPLHRSAYAVTKDDIDKSQEKYDKISNELKEAQKKLENAKAEQKSAIEQLELINHQADLMQARIAEANELISKYNKDIEETEKRLSEKTKAADEKYEDIKVRLRAIRENGRVGYLEIIFGSKSLSDLITSLERANDILSYEKKLLSELEKQQAEISALLSEVETKKQAVEKTASELQSDMESLEKARSEAQALVNKLTKNTEDAQKLKDYYAKLEEDAQKEYLDLIKELQSKTGQTYVGGSFGWPCDLTYKRISSTFGYRYHPISGAYHLHGGIDIPVNKGDKVYASNTGTVIIATYNQSYGYYVVIDHGGGISTLYAHNSKLLVSVGDKVLKGDTIALAGSTGSSTAPHVHFEYRVNGERKNPLNYLKNLPSGWYIS